MILIISQDYDASTDRVIQWLDYYNVAYIRINNSDKVSIENYSIANSEVKCNLRFNDTVLDFDKIDYYWYRRGEVTINGYEQSIKTSNITLTNGLYRFLFNEKNKLQESLNYYLKDIPHLGSALNNFGINKLEILKKATKAGIIVPDTLITSKKIELIQFISKHKKIISKPINESVMIDTDDSRTFGYTRLITPTDLKEIASDFVPTLFQKAIKNFCELRIFYLKPYCYAMAIFHKITDVKTLDYRSNSSIKSNRQIPFQLPKYIETKIQKLMEDCGYKTGSLDMVLTPNNEYVFLEVNPIGQVSMTSYPCNYFLEKKIAKHLTGHGERT